MRAVLRQLVILGGRRALAGSDGLAREGTQEVPRSAADFRIDQTNGESVMRTFDGRQLTAGRALAELTVIELAKAAGVTTRTVNRLEVGGVLHVSEKIRHGHVSRQVWNKIMDALTMYDVVLLPEGGSHGGRRALDAGARKSPLRVTKRARACWVQKCTRGSSPARTLMSASAKSSPRPPGAGIFHGSMDELRADVVRNGLGVIEGG